MHAHSDWYSNVGAGGCEWPTFAARPARTVSWLNNALLMLLLVAAAAAAMLLQCTRVAYALPV